MPSNPHHYAKKISSRKRSTSFPKRLRLESSQARYAPIVEKISPEAKELLNSRTGYRTESAYGEGYRNAKEVIKHEIEELGNTGERREIAERMGLPPSAGLEQILKEIDQRFGEDAKVIWLATKNSVKDYYLDNEMDDNASMSEEEKEAAIDKYAIPNKALLIVDLGYDGQLFLMENQDYKNSFS